MLVLKTTLNIFVNKFCIRTLQVSNAVAERGGSIYLLFR